MSDQANNDLYCIVYFSVAAIHIDETDILELLDKSRSFNADHNITGLLLAHAQHFAQLIEGPELAIKQLFEAICRDSRHHRIELVFSDFVKQRAFSEWSMAYKDLKADPDGIIKKLNEFKTAQRNPTTIYNHIIALRGCLASNP